MARAVHALEYLEQSPEPPAALTVLFGGEWFLKQAVVLRIRSSLFGDEADIAYQSLEGDDVTWVDVADELATVSLFQPTERRLVVVRNADKFVSAHREILEQYAQKPARTAVLVLIVDSFAANTKLYKAVVAQHLAIDCNAPSKKVGKNTIPDERQLAQWATAHAKSAHGVALPKAAAELLVGLAGGDMGRIDQEIAKLAAFAGKSGKISTEMVTELVGGWRAKTAWDMIDDALDGNAGSAVEQLDRLLRAGEAPIALLAQMSYSLRQMAAATRNALRAERQGQRPDLQQALLAAGVQKWQLQKRIEHLRQVNRHRGARLYQWLLEADLALKGSHSPEARGRWVLERLLLRLAKKPT